MNLLTKTEDSLIVYYSGPRNAEEYTETTRNQAEATRFLTMDLDKFKMDRYGFERLEVDKCES
jgi:hypothetical protein